MQLSTRLDLIEATRKAQLEALNAVTNRQTHDAIEAVLDDLSQGLDLDNPDDRATFRQRFEGQVNLRSMDAMQALARFADVRGYPTVRAGYAPRRVADGYINERITFGAGV